VSNETDTAVRPPLVDRADEARELLALADAGTKSLALLYGRRQVGKTYLLNHVWGERRRFYFLCAAQTPELNRLDLLRDLQTWHGRPYPAEDYPTWRTVFRALAQLASDGPVVVVLDEFQYLLRGGQDVTSQLVAVWDLLPQATSITLVLSGSAIATMEHLASGGEPLFGRVSWSHQLAPFDYRDAARMMPGYGPRAAAYLYGVLGGTPRYLAALQPTEPVAEGATRVIVSPRGEVHAQMLTLLEQIQGLRDVGDYRSVLAVAAEKPSLRDIVARTGLEEMSARRKLETLERLQYVRRERNFGASATAPYRYHVADNAVRFWYRFVHPERSLLVHTPPAEFWAAYVAPHLDGHMGAVFERMVRQAFERYHLTWGLPPAREWGRWEGVDADRASVEIDVVARLADRRLLVGEVKWSSAPRGPALHTGPNGLPGKVARLARSGQGWAHDLDDAVHLYASAAGFTSEMHDLAAADPRVHLLALEDLYPERGTPGEP
jgi:hypothetical protein